METKLEPVVRSPVEPRKAGVIDVPLSSWAVKTIGVGLTTLMIAGGATLLGVNEHNAVQDQRLEIVERDLAKINEIDKTLQVVSGKVDVLNQKVDDLKEFNTKTKR